MTREIEEVIKQFTKLRKGLANLAYYLEARLGAFARNDTTYIKLRRP